MNNIEELSGYLHRLRATRYINQKYNMNEENYERCGRKAKTGYKDLSEEDKEKDRVLARDVIEILKN